MGRIVDIEKLIDVLLEERELLYECEKDDKAKVVSDVIGIINHFPEYKVGEAPVLKVSDIIHIYCRTANVDVVMKRSDTGREYRKIRDAMDEKNWWEVVGISPRLRLDSFDRTCKIELVLWCRDRNSSIKDLHRKVCADWICEKYGVGGEEE